MSRRNHTHMQVLESEIVETKESGKTLKGKSSLMIYERWRSARYQYRNREFWCRGYYVDTTGKNTQKIKEYIVNQLKENQLSGLLTMEEADPFTGSK